MRSRNRPTQSRGHHHSTSQVPCGHGEIEPGQRDANHAEQEPYLSNEERGDRVSRERTSPSRLADSRSCQDGCLTNCLLKTGRPCACPVLPSQSVSIPRDRRASSPC